MTPYTVERELAGLRRRDSRTGLAAAVLGVVLGVVFMVVFMVLCAGLFPQHTPPRRCAGGAGCAVGGVPVVVRAGL
ncbi:hypothetical protein ACH427_31805 [Streptomyces sp. NPDC020379]|uniref:hypothetical protein n=1 Tax=Streptomyces sp. NPDC020379 TaxID=3365071 RepID=UPI00378C679A